MIRKLKYIIPAVLLMTSCKKQLDINTDPYKPTSVSEAHLLTGIERSLGDATSQNGLSYGFEVYMHRITVREAPNAYGLTGSDIGWGNFYVSILTNSDFLIAEGTQNKNMIYAGIGEIIKAYAYSLMVDTWGDIPYSEVNKLATEGKTNPKFDKGAEIYPQLIALLDKGIADLKAGGDTKVPGADDLIYGGSTD
ncbi:MAG: SusD/RagB family nutrient-binding outer membrane lipoprotein, partial [Mucilaginibacter sp.]|nr:SusD/RagB family nutrient-binding outer membrane lipoprotein [Mucilaginibacter sp.]